MQLCGLTEGGPTGIYCDVEQVKARPDASGRQALPLTEARVVDPDGKDVEPGGVGELILRGETIMKATGQTRQNRGDHPRRLAAHRRPGQDRPRRLPDHGRRLKDLIITAGRNVYCVEVEGALAAHPDITDVAVVGRPHPDYGESIIAVITPREGTTVTFEDVKAFCADKITRYKIPHDLVVGTIPRTPSGKILKHQLRDRFRETHAATPSG